MRRSERKILPEAEGQATVEFLLSTLFIMITIFWSLEIVMFIYSYSVLADAAKEGVRYAVVHGSQSSSPSGPGTGTTSDCATSVTSVKSVVQNYAKLTLHDISNMTVTVCYLDGNNQSPNRVQIRVSYPYKPYFSLGWSPPTIKAAAEGRVFY